MGKGLTCDVVSGSDPSQVNGECLFGFAFLGLASHLILQGDEDDGVPAAQGNVRPIERYGGLVTLVTRCLGLRCFPYHEISSAALAPSRVSSL